MNRFTMTRRHFLRSAIVGGFAAVIAACSRALNGTASTVAETTATTPASLVPVETTTTAAASTTTAAQATGTSAAPPAVRMIEVINRNGWGASPPSGGFTEHQIQRLTVHHTARRLETNRDAPRAIRIHQRFHQLDRGWSDIAYHFIIDAEGNIYEGRPIDAVGDTGTNYDPTGHFLVACEGHFDEQPTFAPQVAALGLLLGWATRAFDLGDDPLIVGHRDVASTTCPGDSLYPLVADGTLLQLALEHAAGPLDLEYLSDEASLARVAAVEA